MKSTAIQHRKRAAVGDVAKRMVVIDKEKCKPESAAFAYLSKYAKSCGKECIMVVMDAETQRPTIAVSEHACPACVNRCKQSPGQAVSVVKLPTALSTNITHSYGANAFRLHGLPFPRPGSVLGLLGNNGIGKTTALGILRGHIKPNLGRHNDNQQLGWDEIIKYYRGSDLQNFFTQLVQDKLRVVIKEQLNARVVRGLRGQLVRDVLAAHDQRGCMTCICRELELDHLLDRQVQDMSGGELQRMAVACTIGKEADVYMFDEVSSFLDVKQRLRCAKQIRSLVDNENNKDGSAKYVIVVEHDLAILDTVSDYVHCLYGEPGAYGVVTSRSRVRNGINQYLAGYIKSDNMRFRDHELSFKIPTGETNGGAGLGVVGGKETKDGGDIGAVCYPDTTRVYVKEGSKNADGVDPSFVLHVESGTIRYGEVVLLLGENGCGKSTFLSMLADATTGTKAGFEKEYHPLIESVSYKTQQLSRKLKKFQGTVQEYMEQTINKALGDRMFRQLVMKPLEMDSMNDMVVATLSGGQLQRLAICCCLGTPAACYLIDEPSAGLDVEQRIQVGLVVKKWVCHHLGRMALVVEHDLMMAAAMADRVVCYEGIPGVECTARAPTNVEIGFNHFLKQLKVTTRQDPGSSRLRINKIGSRSDREQKKAGNHFLFSIDANDDDTE